MDEEEPAPVGQGTPGAGACGQREDGEAAPEKGGYSLKGNRKRFTGPPHPDRDAQFRHIAKQRRRFLNAGDPVVSVDTKKKELIGNFKNAGRTWCSSADEVNAHDFRNDAECRAVPYGVYDLARNRGFVNVGVSGDTPDFAVDSLARWWKTEGRAGYPDARRLLVLADTGGSNSAASRVFKVRLKAFAEKERVAVTVCHYPTGASKWNPIEHRLFSHISCNWAGKPLRSLKGMLACIRGTATRTGLKVRALLTRRHYPKGVRVTDEEVNEVRPRRHATCPKWNYTIAPRRRRAELAKDRK